MVKKIMIFAALGVLSFGVSFGLSLFLGGEQPPTTEMPVAETPARAGMAPGLAELRRLLPQEKQLETLIADVKLREKDLEIRQAQLAAEAKRVETMRKDLSKQVEALETKRLELAGALRKVNDARAQLEATRIRFGKQERARMERIAQTFDKMSSKATDAAEIIQAMCANGQKNDAVKVLYLMTPSRLYKVLAKIEDRTLTAELTEAMKRVQEEE